MLLVANCMAIKITNNYRRVNHGGRIYGCISCYPRVNLDKGEVLSGMELYYVDPMILLMDSKSAMALTKNPTHHKRSKHIDIKYHWLREHTYEKGTVGLEHCKTEDMN